MIKMQETGRENTQEAGRENTQEAGRDKTQETGRENTQEAGRENMAENDQENIRETGAGNTQNRPENAGKRNLILRLLSSEGMRYLLIGGCTTLVNLITYAVLCKVVKLNVNVSNIISVSVSILFAYVTNKLIVFRSHCGSVGELAAECGRFIGARLATMVIEVGGVFLLYEILHQDEMISKLATQVLVVIGNYFISRFIVFKDRK